MIKSLINIFKVPELRNKVLFTFFMLLIYRIGFWVPLPGVDQRALAEIAKKQDDTSAAGRLASYVSIFSGGNLQQSSIFGLGIMPYISSSIIFQLLTTVVPSLEKLQKEGETGRKKIQEWSRYATVPLCVLQAIFWLSYMTSGSSGQAMVQPLFQRHYSVQFWAMGLMSLTAGSIFLMWLGEQIDEYGLGNGVSLVILAGIVARMPGAIGELASQTTLTGQASGVKPITPGKIIFLIACFVFVVAGSILITQAQRRITIQQAKHTRGRRVYGGQRQYLPLRVNHGGVMPIIFAQSLMLFPGVALSWVVAHTEGSGWFHGIHGVVLWLNSEFGRGHYVYLLTEAAMIYFFAYFWTTVQFQPKEMATQLRDYGSFIPGLRPGKRTADYLEKVMMRITYVGAAFLCVIAVVPMMVTASMGIDPRIAAFLGGTGLLIVVSVALDMIQRIEANLMMRNYGGFLSGAGGKGKRIKGAQYQAPRKDPMPIIIKSRFEIERMRQAGQLGCEILAKMQRAAVVGATTQSLDDLAQTELDKAGAKALSKNYPTYKRGEGFPGHTCISVNEEVVHGVPGPRTLKEGDIVTLDLALSLDGYCADTATTVAVGRISPALQKLLTVTKETLDLAVANMRPNRRWSDIARLMQHYVEKNGYNVVREFVGHGIGREMHEEPKVPNFVTAEQLSGDFTLRRGMTLAVEPMVVAGRRDVDLYKDGWTVFTVDRMPAAHFEHTVAITDAGTDVLTDGRPPVAVATGS